MQLYHGDCLDIMPTLPDQSVDMILCDLPYGTTACHWDTVIPFAPLWAQYKRLIKPRGAIVLFGSQPFTSALIMSNVEWFKYELIWKKTRPSGFLHAKNKPMKDHENILLFSPGSTVHESQSDRQVTYNPQMGKGKPYSVVCDPSVNLAWSNMIRPSTKRIVSISTGGRYPLSVIEFSNDNHDSQHQTAKPTTLLAYLIRTYTNPGDTVLDNCAGSGSTLVACIQERRNGIGIEMDAGYFSIAQERIANTQPPLPLTDYAMPIAPPAQHELFAETSLTDLWLTYSQFCALRTASTVDLLVGQQKWRRLFARQLHGGPPCSEKRRGVAG